MYVYLYYIVYMIVLKLVNWKVDFPTRDWKWSKWKHHLDVVYASVWYLFELNDISY